METICLVPENLFIAFLSIYLFYQDSGAICTIFKKILSKTEEKKYRQKESKNPSHYSILFFFQICGQ